MDFAGSASKRLCDSRVRWINAKGEDITGAGDFDRNYTAEFLQKELRGEAPVAPTGEEFQRAVSNSFWGLFWRGKVSGSLIMALTGAQDMPIEAAASD